MNRMSILVHSIKLIRLSCLSPEVRCRRWPVRLGAPPGVWPWFQSAWWWPFQLYVSWSTPLFPTITIWLLIDSLKFMNWWIYELMSTDLVARWPSCPPLRDRPVKQETKDKRRARSYSRFVLVTRIYHDILVGWTRENSMQTASIELNTNWIDNQAIVDVSVDRWRRFYYEFTSSFA